MDNDFNDWDKQSKNKEWKEITNNLMVYDCGDYIARIQLSKTIYISDNQIDSYTLSVRAKNNLKFIPLGNFFIY